jgi:hypothetical protein
MWPKVFYVFLVVSALLASSVVPIPSMHALEKPDVLCYGFLIPLPQGRDTTNETMNNSLVRHLINDLLRENLRVYWLLENTMVSVLRLDHQWSDELTNIQPGAFFVPFTTDIANNALLTTIVYDYNYSHELGLPINGRVKAYLVAEPIAFQGMQLVEPKIAQHLGTPIRYGWPSYLQAADAGGFLTMEFLLDNETYLLSNKDYNVFIWPYLPDPATYQEQIATFTNLESVNAVRTFVKNGGGYLGTCYGSYAASSGFIFSPMFPLALIHAYTPSLPQQIPLLSLAMSDTLMTVYPDVLLHSYLCTIQAADPFHPLFFGVNSTFTDFLKSPLFFWHGPNTKVLGIFSDVYSRDESASVSQLTRSTVIGRAAWMESTFGDGIMVLFGTHPDFVNNIIPLFQNRKWNGDPYYGRRIIHNALFYVTAEEPIEICPHNTLSPFLISNIINKTYDTPLSSQKISEFHEEIKEIKTLAHNLSRLQATTVVLKSLFQPYETNNSPLNASARLLRYTNWYCDIYSNYLNETMDTLTLLERLLNTISSTKEIPLYNFTSLHDDLEERLQHADRLISSAYQCANTIQQKMENLTMTPRLSLELLKERRQLLQITETLLKYVPQVYFASLKTLLHLYYHYEANIALQE